MALGVTLNNPGNLTVNSSGQILYPGQTGTYNANGLIYAVFGSPQAGGAALVNYIQNNIGTDDATSLTTPQELASYYLNGSYGPLQSSSANPYANNWLSAVDNFIGASPNSPITNYSPQSIAQGIEIAEGNGALGNVFG